MKYGDLKMWINGEWTDAKSCETFTTKNVTTGEDLGRVPLAGKADADRAVAAAKAAFPIWSRKTVEERSKILRKIAEEIRKRGEELMELDALEHGMPKHLAIAPDVISASGNFDAAADFCRHLTGKVIPSKRGTMYCLTKAPVGVCALITPWNLPLFLMAQKVALSLAAGCTSVLKAPSINAVTSLKFAEILASVEELPKGAVNVITGPGTTIGTYLAAHEDVDCVGFTGSSETGIEIMKAASPTLKKLTMELGGKNPAIIFPDANLDLAVKTLSHHQFNNCGQACGSPGRIYVHERCYDEFLEKYAAACKEFSDGLGDPMQLTTKMGPLVSSSHYRKVTSYIQYGIEDGATLYIDGRTDRPNFVGPTVFVNVTPEMRIYRDEIFGPVSVIVKWSDEDTVMDMATDNKFGLTASIWTRNIAHALKLGERFQVGTFSVNCHNNVSPEAPWGGVKHSGVGEKEGGFEGILGYMEDKLITISLDE